MIPSSPGTRPAVQLLDRSASPRILAGQGARRRDVRFREAIVDYRTLLEHAGGAPAPFPADCLRRWADRWPNRVLRSVTSTDLAEYFSRLMARGHTREEIHQEKKLFSSFYRWARRCGWAGDDPTRGMARGHHSLDRPATAWTASEQRRLLDACRGSASDRAGPAPRESPEEPFLYPLVLLGLRTGLPMSAILHLEWRHVDLEKERITIPAHETTDGRTIDAPVGYDARRILTALRRRARDLRPSPRRVLEAVRIPVADGRPDEHGALAAFRRARRRAGLPDGDFRSLRKSFLRNCASAGVPGEDAARMCDWDDPLPLEPYGERAAEG